MLSPDEWGPGGPPHKYLGSYYLDQDQSWVRDTELSERHARRRLIPRMLGDVIASTGLSTSMGMGLALGMGESLSPAPRIEHMPADS